MFFFMKREQWWYFNGGTMWESMIWPIVAPSRFKAEVSTKIPSFTPMIKYALCLGCSPSEFANDKTSLINSALLGYGANSQSHFSSMCCPSDFPGFDVSRRRVRARSRTRAESFGG